MSNKHELAPETKAAHALSQVDPATGAITPSIHLSTTYGRDDDYQLIVPEQGYTRDENPGFLIPERLLAELMFVAHVKPLRLGVAGDYVRDCGWRQSSNRSKHREKLFCHDQIFGITQ